MDNFVIKSSDIERVRGAFLTRLPLFKAQVDSSKSSINQLINLPDSEFGGGYCGKYKGLHEGGSSPNACICEADC